MEEVCFCIMWPISKTGILCLNKIPRSCWDNANKTTVTKKMKLKYNRNKNSSSGTVQIFKSLLKCFHRACTLSKVNWIFFTMFLSIPFLLRKDVWDLYGNNAQRKSSCCILLLNFIVYSYRLRSWRDSGYFNWYFAPWKCFQSWVDKITFR